MNKRKEIIIKKKIKSTILKATIKLLGEGRRISRR